MNEIKFEGPIGLTRPGRSWPWKDSSVTRVQTARQAGGTTRLVLRQTWPVRGGRGWVGTEGLTRMGHVIKEALQKDCSSCPAEKSVEKVISGCHETS